MRRSIGLAAACWWLVLALGALGIGVRDTAPTPGGAVLCLLLILAPTALALPAGRALLMPLWALETIVAWALLGALLMLVDPIALGRGLAFLLLLPAAFGALASPSLLLAAWFAPSRAGTIRRRGYLCAALPVGLLLLRALDALGALTALLFCLLSFLTALLIWSIQRQSGTEAGMGADPATSDVVTAPLPQSAALSSPASAVSIRPVIALGARGRLD